MLLKKFSNSDSESFFIHMHLVFWVFMFLYSYFIHLSAYLFIHLYLFVYFVFIYFVCYATGHICGLRGDLRDVKSGSVMLCCFLSTEKL